MQVVLFCLAAVQALVYAGVPLLNSVLPVLRSRQVSLPLLGTVPLAEVLVVPCAIAITGTWALLRDAKGAWVLGDVMGVALMLLILRQMRLPNIQVCITT
jgi:hypothetical protein